MEFFLPWNDENEEDTAENDTLALRHRLEEATPRLLPAGTSLPVVSRLSPTASSIAASTARATPRLLPAGTSLPVVSRLSPTASSIVASRDQPVPPQSSIHEADAGRFRWTLRNRKFLIDACITEDINRASGCRSKWQNIATALTVKLKTVMTGLQCKNQWAQELQKYRYCLKPPTGSARPRRYVFMDELEAYIGNDPTIRPRALVSSTDPALELAPDPVQQARETTPQTADPEPQAPRRRPPPDVQEPARTRRRVPPKQDIHTMLHTIKEESRRNSEIVLQKYNEVADRQMLLVERILRVEEARVENETIMARNEAKRLDNEDRLLRICESFIDRYV